MSTTAPEMVAMNTLKFEIVTVQLKGMCQKSASVYEHTGKSDVTWGASNHQCFRAVDRLIEGEGPTHWPQAARARVQSAWLTRKSNYVHVNFTEIIYRSKILI